MSNTCQSLPSENSLYWIKKENDKKWSLAIYDSKTDFFSILNNQDPKKESIKIIRKTCSYFIANDISNQRD